jgi:ferredoxin
MRWVRDGPATTDQLVQTAVQQPSFTTGVHVSAEMMVQLSLVHDSVKECMHMHGCEHCVRGCSNSVWEQRHRFVDRRSTQRIRKRSWGHRDTAARGVSVGHSLLHTSWCLSVMECVMFAYCMSSDELHVACAQAARSLHGIHGIPFATQQSARSWIVASLACSASSTCIDAHVSVAIYFQLSAQLWVPLLPSAGESTCLMHPSWPLLQSTVSLCTAG